MQTRLRWIFLFLIVSSAAQVQAQEKTFEPKGSFSVDAGVPTLGRNYAFRRVMEGLFNGGIGFKYNIFKGMTLGIGAKYSFFNINTFALKNANWSGGLHMPAPYIDLSFEKFTTERISLSAGVKIGYAAMISVNDSCKNATGEPVIYGALFFEPHVEALMLTGKGSSDGFSFILGYNIYNRPFTPGFLCMNELPNLEPENYKGFTGFFSIGFGYRYYFGRK